MKLIYYPDPRLLIKCQEYDPSIKEKDKKRRILRSEMFRILEKHNGAGLAAPQVGLDVRMFVWKEKGFCQIIWNPILKYISGQQELIEGCLSIPGFQVKKIRATSSVLIGIGINNLPLQFIGDASKTRIWQHEIDHLDGKLIVDKTISE